MRRFLRPFLVVTLSLMLLASQRTSADSTDTIAVQGRVLGSGGGFCLGCARSSSESFSNYQAGKPSFGCRMSGAEARIHGSTMLGNMNLNSTAAGIA